MAYHFCEHAEIVYVDYNGWVTLLDIDHIECRADAENPKIVKRGECPYCNQKEEVLWAKV